jgi:myo-inositol catabolism protein IolC
MEDEAIKEKARAHRTEMRTADFNRRMRLLHDDIAKELGDTRSAIRDLYNLILKQPTAIIDEDDME